MNEQAYVLAHLLEFLIPRPAGAVTEDGDFARRDVGRRWRVNDLAGGKSVRRNQRKGGEVGKKGERMDNGRVESGERGGIGLE